METLFQVDPAKAPKFTTLVSERKKGGVRISPALDQTGESTARMTEKRPREDRHREEKPRERLVSSDTPGDAPPRKPGFHGKKFAGGKKQFGGKKHGKPGGYKGKKPKAPEA